MSLTSLIGKDNSSVQSPSVELWLQEMDSLHFAFVCIAGCFTIPTVSCAVFMVFSVCTYVSSPSLRTNMYYIILMLPLSSVCSVLGMLMPRTAVFLYTVNLTYYMFCYCAMIGIMFHLAGGRHKLSLMLSLSQKTLNISNVVCCRWCTCFPSVQPTVKNLSRFELMVVQTSMVRIVVEVVDIIVYNEVLSREHPWFIISSAVAMISMFIAFFGAYMLLPIAEDQLRPFHYVVLYRIVDAAQTVYTTQKFVFDLLALLGFIKETNLLGQSGNALFIFSFALVLENMVLMMLMTCFLRPTTSIIYDRFYPADNVEGLQFRYLEDDVEDVEIKVTNKESTKSKSSGGSKEHPGGSGGGDTPQGGTGGQTPVAAPKQGGFPMKFFIFSRPSTPSAPTQSTAQSSRPPDKLPEERKNMSDQYEALENLQNS